MTLTRDSRDAIDRTVAKLRTLFEHEFGQQARGRFGLHIEERPTGQADIDLPPQLRGHVEPESALTLSPGQRWQRRELVGALKYLVGEGATGGQAVERLVREASFTAVNRLLAIRVTEAVGLLPEVIGRGRKSGTYREVVGDLFPALATAEDEGFWTYLEVCGDELAVSVPMLFDRRSPVTAFVPSRSCIDDALGLVNDDEVVAAWREPEALGWAYQFFNSDTERQEMRTASPAPQNTRELAVRNQFFTPSYVVDWLVQNTLGRRLAECGYDVDLPLLVGEVRPQDERLRLADLRVLDPACGSGHFLLGAYDLLEEAWMSAGIPAAEAAPHILTSLCGVDIDHRASQVAQAVLVLRARQAGAAAVEPPMIVTARSLPRGHDLREVLSEAVPRVVRDLIDGIDLAMRDAPTLGTLLKVDELLQDTVKGRVRTPQLGDEPVDSLEAGEKAVLDGLTSIAASVDSSASERMFAADGKDAIRFLELLQRRYDAVLMNPPFGAAVPGTRAYLKSAYGASAADLYSAFVHRGLELCKPHGYVGAITNRTGFFLKTFAGWRRQTLLPGLVCAADLGHGVLHDALVEVAAYVVTSGAGADEIHVRSLLRERDKSCLTDPAAGVPYARARSSFLDLPNDTVSYWVAPSVLRVFADFPRFADVGDARQGLATADDFRFVRLWWEVPLQQSGSSRRWFPFAKGGEYAPWYADLHLVVNWEEDGRSLREFDRAVIRNPDAYMRPGLTWSRRTASGFVVRALPVGSIFADKGCFLVGEPIAEVAAWANSRAARYLIELQLAAGETTVSGGAARSYEVGILQELPYPRDLPDRVADAGREQIEAEMQRATRDETSPHFLSWRGESDNGLSMQASRLEALGEVDRLVNLAYGLDTAACEAIDAEVGPAPASYSHHPKIDREELRRLYALPMQQLVGHVLTHAGAARYVAMKSHLVDRRLELLCHLYRAHPSTVASAIGDVEPSGAAEERARQYLSYLVGAAFGRWDIRLFGQAQELPDPWTELPPTPPGMLTDDAGRPGRSAPHNYPLAIPSKPLLHDDPGHEWDLAARVEAAANALPDGYDYLETALRDIGIPDVSSYLRGRFFEDHLAAYSGSRRNAPIYWQLAVPSGAWRVWLYYPDLNREALFAIAAAAEEKSKRLAQLASQLGEQVTASSPSREVRERLEEAELFRTELETFIEQVEKVAQSGWEPDLNDGAVLCATPLADLFHHQGWRREVTKHKRELEKGAYPWATVQRAYFRSGS